MIISFTIENWMSFRDETTFTMVATRERQHGERIPRVPKYPVRVLPVAAIFGGNASGKTNFFKALEFAQQLVIEGTKPDELIPVEPCIIDDACMDKPSGFKLELLIDELIYEFSFALTTESVIEEKLVKITRNSEYTLYDRKHGNIDFDDDLKKKNANLNFIFQGTRGNQLLLTNSVSQNMDAFQPVYSWFMNSLVMISPNSIFAPGVVSFDKEHPEYDSMNDALSQLDTGISRLGSKEISLDDANFPEPMKKDLQRNLKPGIMANAVASHTKERLTITKIDKKLITKKMVTYHSKIQGGNVQFEFSQESDGTQRVVDLLPSFLDISSANSNKVYIIDELDRSLHTLLSRKLIEAYLAGCAKKSRSQLLFTTHDVLLMDQRIIRRDEMWVTERDTNGFSTMFSFSDYKDIRYDKDIKKSYLTGRLGGIPNILLNCSFSDISVEN